MTKRSMMTIVAALMAAAAGCANTAGQAKPGLGQPSPSSSYAPNQTARVAPIPIKKTLERYKDGQGFQLELSSDEQGNVSAKFIDPNGVSHDAKQYQLENKAMLCSDNSKRDCQTVNFMSDGSFIKLGSSSCTCYVCSGIMYCYGDTCR